MGVCMCGLCNVCVCVCVCVCMRGFCNVWVCVCVSFVMRGCFGNTFTCIYCVLCCLYCVFYCFLYVYLLLFVLFVLVWGLLPPNDNSIEVNNNNNNNNNLFSLYWRKDYCHRVTTKLQLVVVVITWRKPNLKLRDLFSQPHSTDRKC